MKNNLEMKKNQHLSFPVSIFLESRKKNDYLKKQKISFLGNFCLKIFKNLQLQIVLKDNIKINAE